MVVDLLDITFTALSDPTRRMILKRLSGGSATVSQLTQPFGISQQAISKHLAYLVDAKLIEKSRQGRNQICTISAGRLKKAHDWIGAYSQFWDEAFDRLDVLLIDLKKQRKNKSKEKKRVRKAR